MAVVMEYPTAQINLTLDDAKVLGYIKTLLKQLKGVRSVRVAQQPKVEMTEAEFYAKIDKSIASMHDGRPIYTMGKDESAEDFLDRITSQAV